MNMKNSTIQIDFKITGDDFSIEKISEKLELEPIYTCTMDKQQVGKRRGNTVWIYGTGSEVTIDTSIQIKKIERILLPKVAVLCELKERYNLYFTFDIIIGIGHDAVPAVYFESPFTQLVAKLDAKIDLNTSFI
ncbi:DUF4279 domain-containing protein [Anaerovorax odorimutans]|uniref:DUF4279 domain-containing protein n=1 Tax=Anaerovorax odorimutans TaxID=109327 RepID=A0ABT1RSD7_9FIRM|nr:DUF4279 domain-containing protein [Anaerovorax odorimutans]MCQ4637781.1 DUF4279 domain-containing protein [Anaerovorax odorimutans]